MRDSVAAEIRLPDFAETIMSGSRSMKSFERSRSWIAACGACALLAAAGLLSNLMNPDAVMGATSDVTVGPAEVAITAPMIAVAEQRTDDSLTAEVVTTVVVSVLSVTVLRHVIRSRRTKKKLLKHQQEAAAIAAEIAARKRASDERKVFPRIWRA